MLARNVVARLAADVPKTSTHDLSRAARLVPRNLLSSNSFVASLSTSYRAALLQYRRSYATAAPATKPTPKVKRDVKKAAAQKSANTTTTKTKKKTAAKKTAKKPVKPKKKKKVVAKRKPQRSTKKKVLTPEQKENAALRELKAKALKPPYPSNRELTAWAVYYAEQLATAPRSETGTTHFSKELASSIADKYRNLTPAEREHYNHLANERTIARRIELKSWIETHSAEDIREANKARAYLRRKLKANGTTRLRQWAKLEDEREVKRPWSCFIFFSNERRNSGDFKNIRPVEATKLIGEEWNALSASEKQKYEDQSVVAREEYYRKFEQTFGYPPPSLSSSPSVA